MIFDGENVNAGEDGAFTVVVSKNTTVAVSLKGTGISSINAEKAAGNHIYNIQGVHVADNADMKQLPAGIYIINGKKVVKR